MVSVVVMVLVMAETPATVVQAVVMVVFQSIQPQVLQLLDKVTMVEFQVLEQRVVVQVAVALVLLELQVLLELLAQVATVAQAQQIQLQVLQ
jgi:hypothetical protein